MRLASLWPWYSFPLLFGNIGCALWAFLAVRRNLPRLTALRCFLLLWASGGAIQFLTAVLTRAGSLTFWYVTSALSIASGILAFLNSAQVVDHLVPKADTLRAKRIWLLGLPVAFVIGLASHSSLIPSQCVPALLAFDAFAGLISALCVLGVWVTPSADWLPGYRHVIVALGFHVASIALAAPVYFLFNCKGLDVASPLLSIVTMLLYLWASHPC